MLQSGFPGQDINLVHRWKTFGAEVFCGKSCEKRGFPEATQATSVLSADCEIIKPGQETVACTEDEH